MAFVNHLYFLQKIQKTFKLSQTEGGENLNYARKNVIVWDMFSGVGMDTISFGKYFTVLSTEKNKEGF